METFLNNSSTFLNFGFWERLKGRPSKIIISAIAIVRRVSLEVISFWAKLKEGPSDIIIPDVAIVR